MANSVDPDQTAPIGKFTLSRPGAVCSGFMLFASILIRHNVRQLFAADDYSRRHFQIHFFLALYGLKDTQITLGEELYKLLASILVSSCTYHVQINLNKICLNLTLSSHVRVPKMADVAPSEKVYRTF